MNSVVKIDPEIMSGAPCFGGTRVPIQNLIDYLEGEDSIDDFLEGFPTVTRDQVVAFLEEAKDRMLAALAKGRSCSTNAATVDLLAILSAMKLLLYRGKVGPESKMEICSRWPRRNLKSS